MLLGLLPGLRQLRAPFITGVLYLVVGWVAFDGRSRLPGTDDSGGLAHIADLARLVGPGVTLAATGLCAYLLGTFLVIQDWPQFFTRRHWRLLRYTLSKEEFANWRKRHRFRTPMWRRTLSRLAIWRRWRSRSYSPSEFARWWRREDPYNDVDLFDPVWRYDRADGLGTDMSVRRTHSWAGRLDTWVYRQMDNHHRSFTYRDLKSLDPPDDFWGEVYSAWHDFRDFMWRRANNEMQYRGGDWKGGLDQSTLPENVSMPSKNFELRDDQIPPWEATSNGWEKNDNHEWWDFDKNLDEDVHHVVLSEAFLANLPQERHRLIAKLKAQGDVHFNDFDRAKAEAEMRYSAAVPLLLLVFVLMISWSPFVLVGVIVPILIVRQGLTIEGKAFADLYLALQYAGVQSPTMALLHEARERARRAKTATPGS